MPFLLHSGLAQLLTYHDCKERLHLLLPTRMARRKAAHALTLAIDSNTTEME